jgi:DNA uptake protein ComE-like DNA-binding protein
LKQFTKYWFDLSDSERKGLIFLLATLLLLSVAKIFLPYIYKPNTETQPWFHISQTIDENIIQLQDEKSKKFEKSYTNTDKKYYNNHTYKPKQYKLFYFDPNNLPKEKWMQLGLSQKQAESLIQYEKRKGPFKTKEDLKNVFVISEEFYQRVEPYIKIDTEKLIQLYNHQTINIQTVDINQVDTFELLQIPTIDSTLARRILKFKEALGNFHHITQLKDVFGINEYKYNKISPYITINNPTLKTIPLNYCTAKQLSSHPYLTFKQANNIVRHRESKGFFRNISDLLTLELLDETTYNKILPYLHI